jgi:hypothetical protein
MLSLCEVREEIIVFAQVRDPAGVAEAPSQGGGEGGGAGDQRDTDDGADIHVRITSLLKGLSHEVRTD